MKLERLTLDFGPRRNSPSALAALMLLLGLAALLWFGAQGFKTWNSHRLQLQSLAELESRQRHNTSATSRNEIVDPGQLAQLRLVRSTAISLQTPWSDLLAALESAPSESVALLSIEPSVQKHTVKLTAEARNPLAMLNYISALQKDTRLNRAVLISHQVQAQSPGTPVRFQVQAGWGDTP